MSEITTRAEEGAKLYVLMKRGLYWRPDAQGYTGVLADAGRYTAEKAAAYTRHDDPSVKAILESEADEFSPACWEETKLARRDRQLADAESRAASAEAEVERLRIYLAQVEVAYERGVEHRNDLSDAIVLRRVERDAAEASASALRDRVAATLDDACRMSAILLMAGEMTAQERRTAKAVADGIANKVRAALNGGDHV